MGWQGSPVATGLINALGGDVSDAGRGLGQQALSLVRTPGDVLAGRYDVRDLPSVGRDYAGNLAAFGLAMPAPEGTLRLFGGVKAKTADLDALAKAKTIEDTGASPEAVWQSTGWFRGSDGQWKFEIPDTEASWKSVEPKPQHRLGDMLDHPALFEAYPHLADMTVRGMSEGEMASMRGTQGYFSPLNNTISLRPGQAASAGLSTGLHEIQHAIQEHEGFDVGGSPEELQATADRKLMGFQYIANAAGADTVKIQKMLYAIAKDSKYSPTDAELNEVAKLPPNVLQGYAQAWNETMPGVARGKYLSLGGEVESRNVQERHAQGDTSSFPLDAPNRAYAPGTQIIRFRNGTSAVTTPVEHDPFTTSLVPVDHDPFATEP